MPNNIPSITREDSEFLAATPPATEPQPSITRNQEFHQTSDTAIAKQSVEYKTIKSDTFCYKCLLDVDKAN
jgi:hypothetical protein